MGNDSFLFQRLFTHWTYRFFLPGTMLRKTYEAFKELLQNDTLSHDLMAEFEELYYQGKKEDFARISQRYDQFSGAVSGMVTNLNRMNPASYLSLRDYFRKFDFYIRFLLAPPELDFGPPFVLQLDALEASVKLSGGKAHNLMKLRRDLQVRVPDGFVITANSFNYLLEYNNLRPTINDLLTQVNIYSSESLRDISALLMSFIRKVKVPPDIETEIRNAFAAMEKIEGRPLRTAVRSSAVYEDSDQSFAGQYKTVLGVRKDGILDAYREVLASKYTPEALYYRISYGLSDEETPMAVLVLNMIAADMSGVVYTADPASLDRDDQLLIHAVQGLGELLVGGATTPDVYRVTKADRHIIETTQGFQEQKMILADEKKEPVLVDHAQEGPILSEQQTAELIDKSLEIERYFRTPQDVEWCISGEDLYILQCRPLHSMQRKKEKVTEPADCTLPVLLSGGTMAAAGTASGRIYLVNALNELDRISEGAVLVARDTPPDYVRVMDRLVAVVADSGSVAGHFATVCREFGVPLLVGTTSATRSLPHDREVTVDADNLKVYDGRAEQLLAQGRSTAGEHSSPYFRKLRAILDFIVPLKLIDPRAKNFVPESCRSMHDIIRFVHEKGVQSMFGIGDRIGSKTRSAVKLLSPLPLDVFLLDVGGGVQAGPPPANGIPINRITCKPFVALWKGLCDKGIRWEERSHFDWKAYDDVVMAGGIASSESADFASYAVVSDDYLNLNMRFGYHFTIIDCICGPTRKENYCLLRFAGGGGDYSGRSLRIFFLVRILEEIGFQVDHKGDLLDARTADIEEGELTNRIQLLGRLLGATKLMDMALHDEEQVEQYVREFFEGRYNFVGEG